MKFNNLSYNLFLIIVVVISFQYSYWGLQPEVYPLLRLIIITLISIIFLILIKKNIYTLTKVKLLKDFFFIAFLQGIILLFLSLIDPNLDFGMFRDLIIILLVLTLSYSMPLSIRKINKLLLIFTILITFSSLSIIQFYASGFIINEQYLPVPKNQLSPVFGCGIIIGIYNFFKIKEWKKYIFLFCSVILFLSLLVIRGRSVIVSLLLCIIIFVFFFTKGLKTKIYFLLTTFILALLLWPLIYNSLFLNYDLNDINSISTGRSSTYEDAFSLLIKYPFFGEFSYIKVNEYTTHNYLLNLIVKFGIILPFPLIFIYFKMLKKVIKGIFENSFREAEIGLLLVLMLFFVSMFEYSYPFSPASATILPYFLFGQYFYLKNKKHINKYNKLSEKYI